MSKKRANEIIDKWRKHGFLDKLKDFINPTGSIIEHQPGDELSSPSSSFESVQFPIVKRVLAQTVSQDLVSTKPLIFKPGEFSESEKIVEKLIGDYMHQIDRLKLRMKLWYEHNIPTISIKEGRQWKRDNKFVENLVKDKPMTKEIMKKLNDFWQKYKIKE